MNRYYLNIPINSIILLSTYQSAQSSQKMTQIIQSDQSINSKHMLTCYGNSSFLLTFYLENIRFRWPFLENVRFCWTFLGFFNQFNWFNHASPSKSIDSVTLFMKTNWLGHQSTHLERNWIALVNLAEEWVNLNQSTQSSWLVYKPGCKVNL